MKGSSVIFVSYRVKQKMKTEEPWWKNIYRKVYGLRGVWVWGVGQGRT